MSEKQTLRPFFPVWLDDAGLTPAEMRVFLHLLRRADKSTGIAWPAYKGMVETTGISKNTIRRSVESLEKKQLIIVMAKPFAGSCRYRVLPIVPPEGQKEAANSPTRGTNEAVPIVPPEADNSPTRDTSIVPPEGQEGKPKKVNQRRITIREITTEGIQFAQWFKSLLPESLNLKDNWQRSFAETYDDLVRLDNRTPEQIREVSQWARTDSFWQTNFMSPSKLRKRNSDGITYFDVFTEKMKNQTKPTGTKPAKSKHAGFSNMIITGDEF